MIMRRVRKIRQVTESNFQSIVCVLLFLFAVILCMADYMEQKKVETLSMEAVSEEDLKSQTIVALLHNNIEKDLSEYYDKRFTVPLEYFLYEMKLLHLSPVQSGYEMLVGITPVIGPHDSVGYDELTYVVDYAGELTLKQHKHIKDYELPDRYRDIQK
ncbi:MAG: DUF3888 domain-containing protein [Clostridiales bacterium]|nr:DUF3888 domain-containing protein [Clostridiales bacterium]